MRKERVVVSAGLFTVFMLAAVAPAQNAPSISLTKPLPASVREEQKLVVSGNVQRAAKGTYVALEVRRQSIWDAVAQMAPDRTGSFKVSWPVEEPAYSEVWMRVTAIAKNEVVASTKAKRVVVGPRAVYCAPPPPPWRKLPQGDGWLVGGLYGVGGAYPGVYECASGPYTVSVVDSHGRTVATEYVAARHSYRFLLAAGAYTLQSGGCNGRGDVKAGEQTSANTYCRYP